jgi:Ca2+:H+ antiporter
MDVRDAAVGSAARKVVLLPIALPRCPLSRLISQRRRAAASSGPTQPMAENTSNVVSPTGTGPAKRRSTALDTIRSVLRSEAAVILGAITTAMFYLFTDALLSDLLPDPWSIVLFLWLFGTMLWCAFGVVRHADCLAELLGEP